MFSLAFLKKLLAVAIAGFATGFGTIQVTGAGLSIKALQAALVGGLMGAVGAIVHELGGVQATNAVARSGQALPHP